MKAPARKAIPLSVKLQVALRMLGVTESDIDWSHEPALALRPYDEHDYDPPQHSVAHIFIRSKAAHKHITFTDNGNGRGDATNIAKTRRITKRQEQFRQTLLAKQTGDDKPRNVKRRQWPSRGFRWKQHGMVRTSTGPDRDAQTNVEGERT